MSREITLAMQLGVLILHNTCIYGCTKWASTSPIQGLGGGPRYTIYMHSHIFNNLEERFGRNISTNILCCIQFPVFIFFPYNLSVDKFLDHGAHQRLQMGAEVHAPA